MLRSQFSRSRSLASACTASPVTEAMQPAVSRAPHRAGPQRTDPEAAQPPAGPHGLHPAQLRQPRITGPGPLLAVLHQVDHHHAVILPGPKPLAHRIAFDQYALVPRVVVGRA